MSSGKSRMPPKFPALKSNIPTTITHRRLMATRILAVSSFIAHVYSQTYALWLPVPNLPKPYWPNDKFVIAFYTVSALINTFWLSQLFFTWDIIGDILPLSFGWGGEEPKPSELKSETSSPQSESLTVFGCDARIFTATLSSAQVRCLPFNIAGNLFLISWSWAWLHEHYILSLTLLSCNLSVQLYAVFMLLHVDQDDAITPSNFMTHLVMKTGVGLGVLYMWKNWSVVDQMIPHSVTEMLNSGVIFLLMTIGSGPDPTLGICLLYDLAALLSGETSSKLWHRTFLWIMLAVSVSLLIDLKMSWNDNFSWLKGFDNSFVSIPERTGQIALEKDSEDFGTDPDVVYTNISDRHRSFTGWCIVSRDDVT